MEINEGCTLGQDDQDPEIIKTFSGKEEALDELKKYRSTVKKFTTSGGVYCAVTEYYVEENEYDEDGNWIGGGDVWEFSKMPINEEEEEEKMKRTFQEFINAALDGNGVQNDSEDVWVNVDGEQYAVSVESVLGREETQPFEASYTLEDDETHECWEELYNMYLDN